MSPSTSLVPSGMTSTSRSLGQRDADAGGGSDDAVADGGLEDARHPPVHDFDGPRRKVFGSGLDPRLDLAPADRADGSVAERWVRVQPQVSLHLRGRRRPVDLAGPPRLGVGAEQCSPAGRVDVQPVHEVPAYAVQKPFGVRLPGELTGLLRAARVLPPPGSVPPVGPLVDARHGLTSALPPRSRPHSVLKKSSGPQKVLRMEDFSVDSGQSADSVGQAKSAVQSL